LQYSVSEVSISLVISNLALFQRKKKSLRKKRRRKEWEMAVKEWRWRLD